MGKSRTGKIATGCAVLSFFFTILAFSTPNWLESNGHLEKPKFNNLGLWLVCFKGFQDAHHWYDITFRGCWWVFEEEYYIIHDQLLPGFFVATQFFYTVAFTLLLIASFLVALYLSCSREHKRFVILLFVIGSDLLLSAISATIAVIIFGVHGDSRYWMPDWEHNDMGWSYAMAVVGVVFLYISGVLFLVEGRVHRRKQRAEYLGPNSRDNEMSKTSYI